MSMGSTKLLTGVGSTEPAGSAGAGFAGVEGGNERRSWSYQLRSGK